MTKQQVWLQRAGDMMGLKVDISFVLVCTDGRQIKTVARVQGVGPPNGMLVISNYDEIHGYLGYLDFAGFGYSVMSGPGEWETFDLETYKEIFEDWGISAPPASSL